MQVGTAISLAMADAAGLHESDRTRRVHLQIKYRAHGLATTLHTTFLSLRLGLTALMSE
jgi:hypothetical protein